MSDKITNLTSATFDEVVGGTDQPVLVDFWAEWCGPCKLIAPILDEIADEMGDQITVTKLDVDQAGDVAQRHGVMSIPTLMIFRDGEPVDRIVGAKGKAELVQRLNALL